MSPRNFHCALKNNLQQYWPCDAIWRHITGSNDVLISQETPNDHTNYPGNGLLNDPLSLWDIWRHCFECKYWLLWLKCQTITYNTTDTTKREFLSSVLYISNDLHWFNMTESYKHYTILHCIWKPCRDYSVCALRQSEPVLYCNAGTDWLRAYTEKNPCLGVIGILLTEMFK